MSGSRNKDDRWPILNDCGKEDTPTRTCRRGTRWRASSLSAYLQLRRSWWRPILPNFWGSPTKWIWAYLKTRTSSRFSVCFCATSRTSTSCTRASSVTSSGKWGRSRFRSEDTEQVSHEVRQGWLLETAGATLYLSITLVSFNVSSYPFHPQITVGVFYNKFYISSPHAETPQQTPRTTLASLERHRAWRSIRYQKIPHRKTPWR